jgi:chromosome segregation ATPase
VADSKHTEAEIIQARERLARAFTRLSTLVAGIPERIQTLERSRSDANNRVKEAQTLLENERAINAQRDSLSESAKEQLQAAEERIRDGQSLVSERDASIAELHSTLSSLEKELHKRDLELSSSKENVLSLEERMLGLQDENTQIVRQLEELREEHNRAIAELKNKKTDDDAYAVKFTPDERQQILKTVDSLIQRVDELTSPNGHH